MNQSSNQSVSLSQLIRQRRTVLGLTQAQVAADLNVEPESVCLWEHGRRRIELDRLPRLAAALRLDEAGLCRLALSEWHPRLYAALSGVERPTAATCVADSPAAGIPVCDPPAPVAASSNAA
jgi:transcriptional regulator with XRE-family HTH domain